MKPKKLEKQRQGINTQLLRDMAVRFKNNAEMYARDGAKWEQGSPWKLRFQREAEYMSEMSDLLTEASYALDREIEAAEKKMEAAG
jgi:hypothetical protein